MDKIPLNEAFRQGKRLAKWHETLFNETPVQTSFNPEKELIEAVTKMSEQSSKHAQEFIKGYKHYVENNIKEDYEERANGRFTKIIEEALKHKQTLKQ